jgi:hypothetical protein
LGGGVEIPPNFLFLYIHGYLGFPFNAQDTVRYLTGEIKCALLLGEFVGSQRHYCMLTAGEQMVCIKCLKVIQTRAAVQQGRTRLHFSTQVGSQRRWHWIRKVGSFQKTREDILGGDTIWKKYRDKNYTIYLSESNKIYSLSWIIKHT